MRSFKYRLYPTPEQAQRLEAWQHACWEVQRWCIKQRRWATRVQWALRRAEWPQYDNDGMPLVAFPDPGVCPSHSIYRLYPDVHTQGHEVRRRRKHIPAWDDLPGSTLNAIIIRVENQWQYVLFKNNHRGPNEKRIHARWPNNPSDICLTFPNGGIAKGDVSQLRITGRYAYGKLVSTGNKLGSVCFRYHRPLPEQAQIRVAHVKRAADGWYISLACIVPRPQPLPHTGHALGVDLNCIHQGDNQDIAALSDGRIYSVPDNLKKSAQKLAHLQKMVSNRRTRGTAKHANPNSNRTKKRRQRIAKLHQRIARQREHQLHYVARRIVDTADDIKFEDVNWADLKRQGTPRKRGDNRQGGRKVYKGRNRSMSSASPGKLRQLTRHKAEAGSRTFGVVQARNTSKACSACGAVLTEMNPKMREWTCPHCGTQHHRDVNAARNILARDGKNANKSQKNAHHTPRRWRRRSANPSASGDTPRESLPERGSTNSESTAR
jgi:transposase